MCVCLCVCMCVCHYVCRCVCDYMCRCVCDYICHCVCHCIHILYMCVSIQRQYTWLAIYILLLQIYHGDLSARNILIAEGFLLKIADFGLARELNDQEYYRRQTEVRKSNGLMHLFMM